MIVFMQILMSVLAMLGMNTRPDVEFAPLPAGTFAQYITRTDTVLYNQRDHPCEADPDLCFMAIAHEVGGHRLALEQHGILAGINEESAYLATINLTVQNQRANAFAYRYWHIWAQRNKAECDQLKIVGGSRAGC